MTRHVFCLLLLLFSFFRPAAQNNPDSTFFNLLFHHPDPLPVLNIETDLRNLIQGKYKEEYQPAILSFARPGGDTLAWSLRLRARGNRRKEVCYYPSVRLNLKESELKARRLAPFDKVKLVNQCRSVGAFEDYLLKEYLAYRLYNVLTPAGFRVRLARFHYHDTGGREEPAGLYGLVLEPEEEMAARLNAVRIARETTYTVHLESYDAALMYLFEYMIANTDWNVSNLHNMVTLKIPGVAKLTPVPYDFDYSGFVGAPYAVPNEALPIDDVREHFHKGPPVNEDDLNQLIAHFRERRLQMEAVCREVEFISPKTSREALQFLDFFFDMLENPRLMKNVFMKGF